MLYSQRNNRTRAFKYKILLALQSESEKDKVKTMVFVCVPRCFILLMEFATENLLISGCVCVCVVLETEKSNQKNVHC